MFAEVEIQDTSILLYSLRENVGNFEIKGFFSVSAPYSLLMNGFLITTIVPVGQKSIILENSIKSSFTVLLLALNVTMTPQEIVY